jgi:hypothetical protein
LDAEAGAIFPPFRKKLMAQTPILICIKLFLAIPLNQFPKRVVTLAGGDTLKVK